MAAGLSGDRDWKKMGRVDPISVSKKIGSWKPWRDVPVNKEKNETG